MRSAYAALIGLGLGCATAPQAEAPVTLQTSPPRAKAEAPAVLPPGAAQYEPEAECTRPNVDDADGTPACVHVTPADMPPETPLELDEVRLVIAHEFGHVLGLGHSLDENSAMSHSWHTRDRIFVTDHDVESFLALVNQPSGLRIDGAPLAGL